MVVDGVHIITLTSPAQDEHSVFRLEIPEGYSPYYSKNSISLETVYPGMLPYSPELRQRFSGGPTKWGPDLVKIYIDILPNNDGETEGKRDSKYMRGSTEFAIPNIKKWTTLAELTEDFDEARKIKKYKYVNDKDHQGTYITTHEDGRQSYIRRTHDTILTGYTTFAKNLSIRYDTKTTHFKQLVDLDRAVNCTDGAI